MRSKPDCKTKFPQTRRQRRPHLQPSRFRTELSFVREPGLPLYQVGDNRQQPLGLQPTTRFCLGLSGPLA